MSMKVYVVNVEGAESVFLARAPAEAFALHHRAYVDAIDIPTSDYVRRLDGNIRAVEAEIRAAREEAEKLRIENALLTQYLKDREETRLADWKAGMERSAARSGHEQRLEAKEPQ